jgi:hypothetical protein
VAKKQPLREIELNIAARTDEKHGAKPRTATRPAVVGQLAVAALSERRNFLRDRRSETAATGIKPIRNATGEIHRANGKRCFLEGTNSRSYLK